MVEMVPAGTKPIKPGSTVFDARCHVDSPHQAS
jgi:hypothetical protein